MPNSFFPRADAATRARLEQDETLRLANSFDWSKTELGPIPTWPEALRAAVRLMLVSDVPMVMLTGKEKGVLIYNNGYALFAGNRHPSIFGKPVLDAWPEIADFNRENMRRGFAGESWYLADQELVLDRNGKPEPAWMNLNYSPVLDDDGTTLAVLVVVVETTSRVSAINDLAQSEQRFRTLADTMPQMVWSTLPDGYHDYYNARWYEFTGMPEGSTDGEAWNGMFHPDDQERAWNVWRLSLATGDPYRIEYRLRHRSGDYRWVLGRALPIRDARGRIVRWFGTCTDIHETKLVAEEREIVAQELSHRIKNIFAVITGLISLVGRSKPELKQVGEELRARIHALGRAHDFVRPHSRVSAARSQPATLQALIRELLAPYENEGGGRILITGEDVSIDDGAATPLALLFHELATNSAKYGALREPNGTVEVSAKRNDDRVVMNWTERGAIVPAGDHPDGFGSKLISLSVEAQMRGNIRRSWAADGLSAEVDVPFSALNQSAALQARPAETETV
jgi:PAS domain S-box-containing protein